MGFGSFLKKYAAARKGTAMSPTTRPTSVSSEVTVVNPVLPATLPAVLTVEKSQMVLTKTVLPATLKKKQAEIPREERQLRDEKCQYIKMCYEMHTDTKEPKPWPIAAEFVATHFRDRFPRLAARNLMNLPNLRNWRAQLCANPGANRPDPNAPPDFRYMDNLVRDYGHARELYGDPRFYIQLKAILLNSHKVKFNKEYRKLADLWMHEYPELRIPKPHQVRYYLKSLPPRLFALACKGENYYVQHYQNFIARDPDSIKVHECWVADNLECDFYIRIEDKKKGGWKAVRPWVCAIMDVKSEHIVACLLMEEGIDNAVIRAAFASAVLKYGRPMRFLTDNGSDFRKRGFTTPVVFTPSVDNSVSYEHSILKELDIEHRVAEPYNAKAKLVERFFRELNEYCREVRGWVGNCIGNRPASAELWSRPENCPLLKNQHEACEFIDDVLRRYHAEPCPDSKYLKGLSSDQALRAPGSVIRPVPSLQEFALALLMPLPESRKVDPRGPSVTVGRMRYVAVGDGKEKLWNYDNKPVMVKFDMMSIDHCFVFDLDGTPLAICRAEQQIPYFATREEEKVMLSDDALADIRNDRKVLNAMIRKETGGFSKLDPETIAQLPPETFEKSANLRLVDSRTAVQGETHNPRIYVTANEYENKQTVLTGNTVSPATLPPATPEETAALAEIHDSITRKRQQIPADSAGLEEIHNFITKKGDRDDE